MNPTITSLKLLAMMGVCLILAVGCAKKDIQSTSGAKSYEPGVSAADTSDASSGMAGQSDGGFSEQDVGGLNSGQNAADGSSIIPGESEDSSTANAGSGAGDENFPSFGSAGGDSNQDSLSGFGQVDPGQTPLEDRLDDGTLVAKADPNSSMQALQDGQLEGASQGLADVYFEYDSWSIPDNAKGNLSDGAAWLKANPRSQLLVEGHCDERGSTAYNLVLGEKRAKAVLSYLLELGVSSNRMNIVSYGEERPFCNNEGEECHKMNRRGHLVVQTQ